MASDTAIQFPKKAEQTKKQMVGDAIGMLTQLTGFNRLLAGTYKTYRRMRANPTIALARAVATAPIRIATWSIETEDDFKDDPAKDFLQEELKQHWRSFIKNLLLALDYGWAPFEKVWDVNKDGRYVYKKLKPLLVDRTKILVDIQTGVFQGLRNIAVELPPNKCFLYTYEGEAGNMYGRSRHENVRSQAWIYWDQIMERYGKYITKVSGIIPMIEYPEGKSNDAGGAEIDNFEIAKKVLQNLGSGHGVVMPNTLVRWAEDAVKSGVDVAKLKSWVITFLEAKGQHAIGFVKSLRHIESLMMRGWLVPERAATEGQYGTKAESETQGTLGLLISDLLYEEILETINWYLVNPLLVYNFGGEYENKLWLERSGPDNTTRELLAKVMEKVLTEPDNIDLFMQWMNVDAVIDGLNLPKADETIQNIKKEPTIEEDVQKQYDDLNDKLSKFV